MTDTTLTALNDANARSIAAARRVLQIERDALDALADNLDERFAHAVDVIAQRPGRVICAGVGKSGHVAHKIAATLASTGTPAFFVHPTEASHGDLGMIGPQDAVLALSKSGETHELGDLIAYCARFAVPLIAMTAGRESALGRAAGVVLEVPKAEEACAETRAPTTSTTMMMALGDALAVALLERRGFSATDFKVFHPGGALGAALATVGDVMHPLDRLPLVAPDAPMSEALLEMTQKGFGCVGVVGADGRLAGIVTDGDLRRHMGEGLLARPAGEVMTPDPLTVRPDTLAAEAMRLMTAGARKITVVFALENERPVGLIHIHDLLRIGVA